MERSTPDLLLSLPNFVVYTMKKKLTLVTVQAAGVRISEFVYISPCKDGKMRVTGKDVDNIFRKHQIHLSRGTTVSIG